MATTLMDTTSIVLKTDSLGRVRTSARRREELLDEFARSGLSGVEFAKLVGVRYPTFATWTQQRRKLAAARKPRAAAVARFVQVVPGAQQDGGMAPLQVSLPGGASLRIADAQQAALAAALIKALDPRVSC
ncbi:MAG: hypothetical protein RL033_1916 [Pseudomonadota bacterium]